MNNARVQHLDASRVASKAQRQPNALLAIPEDRWAGLRDGGLRADGLLASRLASALTEPAAGSLRDAEATRQARGQLWCTDQCSACDAPSVIGDDEIHQFAGTLDGLPLHNERAESWIEGQWQVQRELRSDEVRSSGLLKALARTRSGQGGLDRSELVLSLARLLVGPPSTRVHLLCMGVPAFDELGATIELPGGWQGGGFPGWLFSRISPHRGCWPDASYTSFDLFEAWPLWWAWRLEDGCVPELPDPMARWYPDTFRPPTDPERLITLLHQITFPQPVGVAARFLAFTGQGLACLDGGLRPTYEAWGDPWELVDPLRDQPDPADVAAIGWDYGSYLEPGLHPADPHANHLSALAALVMGVDPADRQIRRISRAAEHLLRAYGRRRDEGGRTALELSIALELLLNDGGKLGEITSSLAQRAALLVGGLDDERRETAQLVADLYALSSSYRHGADLPVELDREQLVAGKRNLPVEAARRALRQTSLSLLALAAAGVDSRALITDAAITAGSARLIDEVVSSVRELGGTSLRELDESAHPQQVDIDAFITIRDDDDPTTAEVVPLRPQDRQGLT